MTAEAEANDPDSPLAVTMGSFSFGLIVEMHGLRLEG